MSGNDDAQEQCVREVCSMLVGSRAFVLLAMSDTSVSCRCDSMIARHTVTCCDCFHGQNELASAPAGDDTFYDNDDDDDDGAALRKAV